jgi:hypothetical protein
MLHIPASTISPLAKMITAIINLFTGQKERRIKACAAFREVVYRELQGLYPLPSNWPKKLGVDPRLRNSFPALQTAVATFRAYVPRDKQGEFDKAWLLYYNAYKQDGTQSYHHYMNFGSSTVNTFGGISHTKQNGKENFKRNVDRLLAFAQDV